MYICKSLVELLTWHRKGASLNVLIQCVPNYLAWKHINGKWSILLVTPTTLGWGWHLMSLILLET
jgi:hypothetical protein